jgi:hypothetical protein
MNRFDNLPIRRKLTAIFIDLQSLLVLCAVFFIADKLWVSPQHLAISPPC